MSILGQIGSRATPQDEQARPEQVPNNAGGYTFEVDDWQRLTRFLVLGVDAGTYYVTPQDLAVENAKVVSRCLDADPIRTVDVACQISDSGRAPQNDPAIFVLAMAAAHPGARTHALARLGDVCRIGTHLFHFARFVEAQRGWGRGLRRAVAAWYERDDIDGLAYQAVKYRQRDGWTHRDLLRLAHPQAPTPAHAVLYDFICSRPVEDAPRVVEGYLKAQASSDADETAALVREYQLPWEALTAEHLTSPKTWDALLASGALPLGALVRNLGVMTDRGVLAQGSAGTVTVVERLADVKAIRKARLHPIALLNALITYQQGHGMRGNLSWTPVSRIVDALDAAFYASFDAVEPAGKRTVLALDVSGSMAQAAVAGCAFSARVGSVAMAMVTAATEPEVFPMAFSHQFVPIDLSARRRLDDQVRALSGMPFGGTDCSLPVLWADANNVEADTFIVYTDNETWAGSIHPHQALERYRQRTGIPARMIVVGMTSTGFTIADPSDPRMLDVVGFDTSAPGVMSAFSAGRF